MSPLRTATILAIAAIAVAAASSASALAANASDQAPSTCPVTKPPDPAFRSPPPYHADAGNGMFWFGTEKLWIGLNTSGVWSLRHYTPEEPSFRQKMLWFRQGYKATAARPKLVVTGKRLDGPAPPLGVDGPHGAWLTEDPAQTFMTVGYNIPTTGCWEITGEYGEDILSFVVWVRDGRLSHRQAPD